MNKFITISKDNESEKKLRDLVKKSPTAFALLMYLKANTEPNLKIEYTYTTFSSIKEFLGREREATRTAINILRDMKIVKSSAVTYEELEFEILI